MRSNRHGARNITRRLVATPLVCTLLAVGLAPAQSEKATADLLRFENGDSLHGKFLGMKDSEIRWRHSEARETINLKTIKLRRVAFNGGRSRKTLRSPSFVHLQGGDRIPGTIISLDREKLVLETEFAGTTTIPREFISQVSPNPHGGAVHYIGPFSEEDWTVIEPKPEPEEAEGGEQKAEEKEAAPDPDAVPEEKTEGPWVFSGGAYYSNGQLPIAIDTNAPGKTRIRFTLAWRNRLNAAIAFHATLKQPEVPAAEEGADDDEKEGKAPRPVIRERAGTAGFAYTYGHSYVLTIYSNYAQIYRCGFNEDGEADMKRLSNSSANLRLEETGQAEFELRCDREAGTITLFANGRYISQWKDGLGYVATGSHLAFACQSGTSRLRVSDVVVTSWNGMIDSAQSMEADNRDIILLTNGTDRFSGDLISLVDGKYRIKGTYAEMIVPQEDVQEIRLAREKRAELDEEERSRQAVRLLLQPYGRLTVRPQEATADRMRARHPAMGDLTLDLRYMGLMEFSFSNSVLDSWDDDY